MNDAQRARWRARIVRLSNAQVPGWLRDVRAEFKRAADAYETFGYFDALSHMAHLEQIYTARYAGTGGAFFSFGLGLITAQQSERRTEAPEFGQRVASLIRSQARERPRMIAESSQRLVTRTLMQAAEEGLGEAATGRRIRQALSGDALSVARARAIARTEIGAAQNAGMIDAADHLDVDYIKRWVTIKDGNARLTHEQANDQTIKRGKKFQVGASQLEYPGDPEGAKEEIINCFPGSTPAMALGAVRKIFRRRYHGPVVTIDTVSGHTLTGTPNHPMLTPHGWVALGELKSGDDLICHRLEIRRGLGRDKPQRQPITLAQAFELGEKVWGSRRASGARQDFHGDGMEGEVDVVVMDRQLGREHETSSAEGGVQVPLPSADMSDMTLPCSGALLDFIRAAHHAADGGVGSAYTSEPLLGRHGRHRHSVGVGATSDCDAGGEQDPSNRLPANPALAREGKLTDAGDVIFNDRVCGLRIENGTHEMFTLETATNAFVVGGFAIARNCRCTVLMELE